VRARWIRNRPLVTTGIAVIVFLATVALRQAGLLQALELGEFDRLIRHSGAAGSDRIALVDVREEEIRAYGYPVCDAVFAHVIDTLLASGARVVGLDIYRDVPVPCTREIPGVPIGSNGSGALELAITRSNRVVAVTKLAARAEFDVPAPAFLGSGQRVGFSDILVDPGGIVRRGLLMLWRDGDQHLSFALRMALRYLADDGIHLERAAGDPRRMQLGRAAIPRFRARDGGYAGADDGGYQLLLEYAAGPRPFPFLALRDVIEGRVAPETFRDKIVIVGTTAPSVKDLFYTPYSASLRKDQAMFGIEIHAHVVSQLLRMAVGEASPMASLSEPLEVVWILFWSLLGAGLALRIRSFWMALLTAGGAVGGLTLAATWLFARELWIPVAPALLAGGSTAALVTAYLAAVERVERSEVTGLFSRFLRPAVLEELWARRDEFMSARSLGRPQVRPATVTVLMSDLVGFNEASRKLDATVLMGWLNECMSTLAATIEAHGGVVDDYAGDGIKANFGFPVPRATEDGVAEDARHALLCALAMIQEIERLNRSWQDRGLPTARLRIGVVTGPVVIGALGGGRSLKYTTVGEAANRAARVESYERESFASDAGQGVARILVSEETMRRAGDGFDATDLGSRRLDRSDVEVRIFRVKGLRPVEVERCRGDSASS
jgi:adenylate cyclase